MPHTCHARFCTVEIPERLLMCRRHWLMVPANMRQTVWQTYRHGQEVSKEPTLAYIEAAIAAVHAVAAQEGH